MRNDYRRGEARPWSRVKLDTRRLGRGEEEMDGHIVWERERRLAGEQ